MGYRDEASRYVLTYWAAIATFTGCWAGRRWFERRGAMKATLDFLGSISYGIYLLAPIALLAVGGPVFAATGNAWLAAQADLSATILAAWMCHRWIEAPAMRWGRRGATAPAG